MYIFRSLLPPSCHVSVTFDFYVALDAAFVQRFSSALRRSAIPSSTHHSDTIVLLPCLLRTTIAITHAVVVGLYLKRPRKLVSEACPVNTEQSLTNVRPSRSSDSLLRCQTPRKRNSFKASDVSGIQQNIWKQHPSGECDKSAISWHLRVAGCDRNHRLACPPGSCFPPILC